MVTKQKRGMKRLGMNDFESLVETKAGTSQNQTLQGISDSGLVPQDPLEAQLTAPFCPGHQNAERHYPAPSALPWRDPLKPKPTPRRKFAKERQAFKDRCRYETAQLYEQNLCQ